MTASASIGRKHPQKRSDMVIPISQHPHQIGVNSMIDNSLEQLAAAFMSGPATGTAVDAVSSFERRELMRIINSRAANRERFMQKLRSPSYQWSRPEPRR